MSADNSENKQNTDNKGKKQAFGKLQMAVLLRTLFPMLIMGAFIALATTHAYERSIKKEIAISLEAVAEAVKHYYDVSYEGEYELRGDEFVSLYKGEKELTGDYGFIDDVKKDSGLDITLFYGNTRILTTLTDANGARYVATGVNSAIFSRMEQEQSRILTDVAIGSEKYYACYIPILDSNGDLVCMVATAKKTDDIVERAKRTTLPIWIVVFVSVFITAIIEYSYTGKVINAISKIDKFLAGMIRGELGNVMPPDVLARKDELGSTAKSMIEMQTAVSVLVERDPLTQLYNRRYGGARIRNVQKNAVKCGTDFSIVMGDIDFFKSVNDTYSHEAGDMVLCAVSEVLRKFMAGKGFAARWGGEEFVLVFKKNNGKEAAELTRQLLDEIRKIRIDYEGKEIMVTMTFGVVDGSESSEYGALLNTADERLYFGKKNGRNRVVTEDERAAGEEIPKMPEVKPAEHSPEAEAGQEKAREAESKPLINEVANRLIEGMASKIVEGEDIEEDDESK